MRRLPALQSKEFRSYLFGVFISNVGNSVQAWAISWHVYTLTNSSLMVGILGLVRIGPLLLFSLFGGVLADHADRRRVMLVTQAGMALCALALFMLTTTGSITIASIYIIVALSAVARAFDGPARQALFVNLVPPAHFPNAASLNGVSWRLSDVLGPIGAGILIASAQNSINGGVALCYAFNFVTFVGVFVAVLSLKPQTPLNVDDRPKTFRSVIYSIREGLSFVRQTPVLRSAMFIDFWATLLSGAEALIPAFASEILKLDAKGYGILAASSGLGALLAAAGLSVRPTVANQGRLVVQMIATFGLFTIGFGLSRSLVTASLCLALVGASDMISTVMRQTIRQLATPDALRGRMNATSSLFHISGPQLGDFEAGAVANAWGERVSIVLGGGLCVLLAAYYSRVKALVDYRHRSD